MSDDNVAAEEARKLKLKLDGIIRFLSVQLYAQPVNKDLVDAMDEVVALYDDWVEKGKP